MAVNMKTRFTLSTHAVEKHLDHTNVNASIFFNRRIMYHCVEQCLDTPDILTKCGKRFELTKSFPFCIGLSQFRKRMYNTIRVVYTKTKTACFVITAYPISQANMYQSIGIVEQISKIYTFMGLSFTVFEYFEFKETGSDVTDISNIHFSVIP